MEGFTISKPGMQSIKEGSCFVDLTMAAAAADACCNRDKESAKTGV